MAFSVVTSIAGLSKHIFLTGLTWYLHQNDQRNSFSLLPFQVSKGNVLTSNNPKRTLSETSNILRAWFGAHEIQYLLKQTSEIKFNPLNSAEKTSLNKLSWESRLNVKKDLSSQMKHIAIVNHPKWRPSIPRNYPFFSCQFSF